MVGALKPKRVDGQTGGEQRGMAKSKQGANGRMSGNASSTLDASGRYVTAVKGMSEYMALRTKQTKEKQPLRCERRWTRRSVRERYKHNTQHTKTRLLSNRGDMSRGPKFNQTIYERTKKRYEYGSASVVPIRQRQGKGLSNVLLGKETTVHSPGSSQRKTSSINAQGRTVERVSRDASR